MLKRLLTRFFWRKARTFVFGENKVALLTGTVGGEHVLIIVDREDRHLRKIEATGITEVGISPFKNPVVLKFPTPQQAEAVAAALSRGSYE